ncbi:hypothetical protein [Carbonactinospora thermoautotrophica]|uniref:hypothetical protein n=1 Tax=Carbonactinospora thermoautotrophica TaxID=1469144 RepID=UPI000AA05660|nr:hypothetical protein [Carbonactinospora thermoautotrophica]
MTGDELAQHGGMVLKDCSPAGDLLRPPVDYRKISQTGGGYLANVGWRPIPP